MIEATTIQVSREVVEKLKSAKEYGRQTYDELLDQMVDVYISAKKRNTYDEFLHKIQQAKMKELWDNKEDEAWESA